MFAEHFFGSILFFAIGLEKPWLDVLFFPQFLCVRNKKKKKLFLGVGKEEGRGNEGLGMFVESGLVSVCSSNAGSVIRWLLSTKRL